MAQKGTMIARLFLALSPLLLAGKVAMAQADGAPLVWRAAFVSNSDVALIVRESEDACSVHLHSLETGATRRLGEIQHGMPLIASGSSVKTVFVTAVEFLYTFNVETGEQNCLRMTGKESLLGVVGRGRSILGDDYPGMITGFVSHCVQRVMPFDWLRNTLPRASRVYFLKSLATGGETASHTLQLNISPHSPARIGTNVADVDEDTFAVVEMVHDFEDTTSRDVFQIRGFDSDTLEEEFIARFTGMSRGVRVLEDGTLLVVSYTYEDESWRLFAVEPQSPPDKQPEPRVVKTVKDKTGKGAQLAEATADCLILAQGNKVVLHALESGEENSTDLGARVWLALSPDGNRLLTWHPYDAGLDMNLFDVLECQLQNKRSVFAGPVG